MATLVAPEKLREGIPAHHLRALERWPQLIAVRSEVLKALEAARVDKVIGGALEARVVLEAAGELAALLTHYRTFLPTLFIASQVELAQAPLPGVPSSELPGLKVKVERASGEKCHRCWNYSELVGKDTRYPMVCERCSAALKEIEAGAA